MELSRENITIFVVDDEFAIRDSLSLLIKSTGLKVKDFGSAISFLKYFNPDQPGCLVIDIRMPYMNGLELQEELIKRNSDIPIIFISGHADIPISSKAFRAGAVDFLEKPFDSQVLLTRINEMIEQLIMSWPKIREKRELLSRYEYLTPREKEIFMFIVNNHSNKQTAKELGISNRTVDVHRAHVMEKMGADSLNTLVLMAVNAELIK